MAIVASLLKGHYRLGHNELQGYLILFDPHAQTHDQRRHSGHLLSQLVVPCGSSHITAPHMVQMAMPAPIDEGKVGALRGGSSKLSLPLAPAFGQRFGPKGASSEE